MSAYYRFLTSDDKEKQMECARAWSLWEMTTCKLFVDPESLSKVESDDVSRERVMVFV